MSPIQSPRQCQSQSPTSTPTAAATAAIAARPATPAIPAGRPSQPGRSPRLSRTRLALLLLAVLAALLPAAPAAAQRVRDVFPDPLAGRDLDEIGRRIGMSDFQRLAVDPAHVRYLDAYRDLRERELEPFLTDLTSRGRTFFFNPDPDLVREFLRRLDRAERRIATLDAELFAAFDEVLTADQRERMPMVRQRRELDRLNSGFIRGLGSGIPATTTDFGRIIDRADLTPAERERIQPLVFAYENRVANARRRVRSQGERVLVELVEEAARVMQQVLAGGELRPGMENVWEQLRQTAYEKIKPVMADLVSLVRINRDVIDQWGPLLPPRVAEQLRTIHYQYGYREALDRFVRVREQYDRALRLPSVDEPLREQIQAMRTDLVDRSFRTIERFESEALEAIKEARFILEDEDAPEIRRLEEGFNELESLWRTSSEALAAVLGEDRMELLDRPEDEGGPVAAGPDPIERLLKAPPARLLASQPDVDQLEVPEAEFDPAGPFIAGPISERELRWYAAILDLDEMQREMMAAIRLDHLDRFETFRAEHIEPLEALMARVSERGDDQSADSDPGPAEAAAAVPGAWAAADQALAALDAAFFQDLELVVLDPGDPAEAEAMSSVRQARERVRLAVGRGRDIGGWSGRMARSVDDQGGLEHAIDLDLLMAEASRGSAGDGGAGGTLEDYARARADRLQAYRQAWRTYASTLMEMATAPQGSRRDGNFWQRMNAPRNAVTEARQSLVELNRQTLDRIERAAPADGAALRDRYQRAAYPSVYDDEQSAEGPLLAALDLPDLGADQRDRIRDLMALYMPRQRSLSDDLVEQRMMESVAPRGRREWQERAARANRVEQHVFDREELNARTLRALRSVLDESQAQEVGFAPTRR